MFVGGQGAGSCIEPRQRSGKTYRLTEITILPPMLRMLSSSPARSPRPPDSALLSFSAGPRPTASAPGITGGNILRDGNFTLTFTGTVGQAYTVRASTNLALPLSNWTVLQSGALPGSPYTYHDLTATNYLNRFYILSTP